MLVLALCLVCSLAIFYLFRKFHANPFGNSYTKLLTDKQRRKHNLFGEGKKTSSRQFMETAGNADQRSLDKQLSGMDSLSKMTFHVGALSYSQLMQCRHRRG